MLSGWKHLQRFYKITGRKPLIANLQKPKTGYFSDTFWILVYPGSFYVSIKLNSNDREEGHEATLYYCSSFRRNFPIAVAVIDEFFNKISAEKLSKRIYNLVQTKSLFQSQPQAELQIPL